MKKMKLWKKILMVIGIVLVLFIAYIVRNYIILTNLMNTGKQYENSTNYYAEIKGMQGEMVTISQCYRKDDVYLTTARNYKNNMENDREMIVYLKDDEGIVIVKTGEEKLLLKNGAVNSEVHPIDLSQHIFDDMFKLQMSVMAMIKTEELNGTKCYLIKQTDGLMMWVDKETGLIIKEKNDMETIERTYRFDIVTDENIVKPDISDCTVVE